MIEQGLLNCFSYVKNHVNLYPTIAIVLKDGSGNFENCIDMVQVIEYKDIPGFPLSKTLNSKGRFVFGYINSIPIALIQGKGHHLEGKDMQEVVLPIRILHMLGAKILILTNSSYSLNYSYQPGELILVKDQIANFAPSCLRGKNIQFLGTRFPDMSEVYNNKLRKIIHGVALKNKIQLKEGIFIQTAALYSITPAELKMYQALGADLLGMDTACEAIAANHAGMKVCCISHVVRPAVENVGDKLIMNEEADILYNMDQFSLLIIQIVKEINCFMSSDRLNTAICIKQ